MSFNFEMIGILTVHIKPLSRRSHYPHPVLTRVLGTSNQFADLLPDDRLAIETVVVRIAFPAFEDRDGMHVNPRAPATTDTKLLQARDLDKSPDDLDLGFPTTIKEATTTADPDGGNEAELVLCGNFGCPQGYTFNSAQLGICLCRKIHDHNGQ